MKKSIFLIFLIIGLGLSAQTRPVVSILGDSYSTFEGFIPEGSAIWYYASPSDRTDVTKVEETWWWQVVKDGGYRLGVNNSWSGATVCNTGYSDRDYTERSFVTRSTALGCPDIILICGATNDSWAGVKMGDYLYDEWKRADLYYFRPAMAKMLDNIRLHYPNVPVYFILNSELKAEINESVEKICSHYSVPVIKLHDIDKQNDHPTVAGMKAIADQVLEAIRQ